MATEGNLVRMSPRVHRYIPKLVVVVPVILASLALGARGVPPLRRLVTSAALGLILIAIMTAWRLTQGTRSERQ